MRIGIDIRALSDRRTGIGRYLEKLIEALADEDTENEYVLYYNAFKGSLPKLSCSNFPIVSTRWPNKLLSRLWSRTSFPAVEKLIGPVDVFHAPNFQMAPVSRSASVLTIHDLVFCVHPELAAPGTVRDYRPWMKRYCDRADSIAADSRATANDIVQYLNVSPEKVSVVYPGATAITKPSRESLQPILKKLGIESPYILFVGTIEPRKNLARLLKSYDISGLSRDFALVLVGPKGWKTEGIFSMLHSLESRQMVIEIDYIDNRGLAALYSEATLLAYPSLMEGFGLPILEAMSVGCPVLTSNVSSMPEVGGDAAFYVNPNDVESIASGLRRLSGDSDLREKLIESGYRRIAEFPWSKTARQMIDIYKKAGSMHSLQSRR